MRLVGTVTGFKRRFNLKARVRGVFGARASQCRACRIYTADGVHGLVFQA